MYDRQIVAFIRSADCGSFTKAADALYTTAASVMNQVNSLESRVGTPLFHRNQKGLTLTAAGASLYQDAQTIVQLSEEAMDRARKLAGNAQTVFRVGTSLLNPCEAFLNVWNRVETRYPQYKLQVVPFSDTKAGITGVLDQLGKDIDFIIGTQRSSIWRSSCSFFPLGNYTVSCVVPRNHRLAAKSVLELSDLYGEDLMIGNDGDMDTVHSVFAYLKKEHPKIRVHHLKSYDIDTFNTCALSGFLLLAASPWTGTHPSLINIPIHWDYTTRYGILYAKTASSKLEKLFDVLETEHIGLQAEE